MNKDDIIVCILIFILGLILYLFSLNKSTGEVAIVYYDHDEVLRIDLKDKSQRTYTVNGYNGDILIETIDGKVRVVDEISPKHLCSKQGFINSSSDSIICLPNKVVIEITSDEVDTVVR